MTYREPTCDECTSNAIIYEDASKVVRAIWYPQIGGYHGVALVEMRKPADDFDPCFDVLVWHDGEFPFHDGERPVRLHHCSYKHFVEFGLTVRKMIRTA